MEDESRSVSGFLHFDTASKGNHSALGYFSVKHSDPELGLPLEGNSVKKKTINF